MPDPAQAPKLFFAFATGNNHANLPILINLARAGDKVCWVVTETANTRGWADGSIKLFRKHGILGDVLPVDDDIIYRPKDFEKVFEQYINEKFPGAVLPEIYFLLVGGQKLNIQAVSQFREIQIANRRSVTFLYQDLKPCCYHIFGVDDEVYQPEQFAKPFLLQHLLDSHGWTAEPSKTSGEGSRHTKNEKVPKAVLLQPVYGLGAHGGQKPDTRFEELFGKPQSQQIYYEWRERKFGDRVTLPDMPRALKYIAGSNALISRWEALLESVGLQPDLMNAKDKLSLVKCAGDLLCDATNALKRTGSEPADRSNHEDGIPQELVHVFRKKREGGPSLADLFEDAVWARVKRFLDEHPEIATVISQVYRNVDFYARTVAGGRNRLMEIDILLVLNNAALVAIECKNRPLTKDENGSERKDSLARLMNLNRTAGFGAHLLYCLPFFPPPESDEMTPKAFLKFHNSYVSLQEWGIDHICYDDPTRGSTKYRINTEHTSNGYEYRSFEAKLEKILGDFLPKPRTKGTGN